MRTIILACMFFLASLSMAFAADPFANHKSGDEVNIAAFCMLDPDKPAELTKGMKMVLAAIVAIDGRLYMDLMMDPKTGCRDYRFVGPMKEPGTLVALNHTFIMKNKAGEDTCYAIWEWQLTDESHAFTWLYCNSK